MPDTPRTRTIQWSDPAAHVDAASRIGGLGMLEEVIAGRLPRPPIAELMDVRLVEAAVGRAVFEGTPAEYHGNPLGIIHGGYAAMMLDSAMGCAVHSHLAAGERYTTLELKVNFARAITTRTGPLRAVATTVHVGRTTAIAEARLVDGEDRLYAHATCTCLVIRADG
ncbi:MAG: PaaI family thioesterase [Acidobacteriota bacterium]